MHYQAQEILSTALAPKDTVMLSLSQKDESLRYIAKARPINRSGEFVVYIAESSKLLDLLRLNRSLEIFASFDHQASYQSLLSLTSLPAPLGSAAIALTIKHRSEDFSSSEGYLNPLT
jgi:hypothetical protein